MITQSIGVVQTFTILSFCRQLRSILFSSRPKSITGWTYQIHSTRIETTYPLRHLCPFSPFSPWTIRCTIRETDPDGCANRLHARMTSHINRRWAQDQAPPRKPLSPLKGTDQHSSTVNVRSGVADRISQPLSCVVSESGYMEVQFATTLL